ncbi:MAG: homocysteine S-methyltransferase family protein, partial [Candidatus Aminicenantes bacterium]|nr:homocysteine S-methyltransferase family protein [Candidatus Aminicenantes bacterium]
MRPSLREHRRAKVLVFDGATGTSLQRFRLTPDDFHSHVGCLEYLVLSRPDLVRAVHASYYDVGCEVVETNTLGANRIALEEFGLADRAFDINREAARLARDTAAAYETAVRPRYVSGSIGPGTKLPSLGQVSYRELKEAYYVQALGLIDGGVDLFQVETCQDILQAKAALSGLRSALRERRADLPVIVQVTIQANGRMLLGTDIAAALTACEPFPLFAFGLNCATGPQAMAEPVRFLGENSPFPIAVMPNAGLPVLRDGETVYDLQPAEFAAEMARFVRDFGVGLVGGCCGTTPEHLADLVRAVDGLTVRERNVRPAPAVSSLYLSQPLATSPRPLIIGERTNASGSRRFRDALVADDLERMTAVAFDQQKELAHVLDVCVAYAGREEARDMSRFAAELTTRVELPLMLDTTDPAALEAGLERTAGRAIINSVNLEDGGARARRVLELAREFGAAVVGLTIDERGMALVAERKLEIARRLHDLATREFGLRPGDLLFDPLTFTLASGDPQYRRAGLETLRAVRLLKDEFPASFVLLGVSNCSYGLRPELRHILNSIFLFHAVEAGLDAAILHAGRVVPLDSIPENLVALCEDLIFDRGAGARDPLRALLEAGAAGTAGELAGEAASASGLSLEERLVRRIVEARADGLHDDLDAALERHAPLEIINRFLLEGMRRVGELFGAGRM